MLFYFKKHPEDFVVHEQLGRSPSGQGDFFYVLFQKTSRNTMDLITQRSQSRGVEKKQLGVSGIKDRNAITRQRMSIERAVVDANGGEESITGQISNEVTVLQTTRHDEPLRIGQHQLNNFTIRLRARKPLTLEKKVLIEKSWNEITRHGFPNCFGTQRFGPKDKNFYLAKQLLEDADNIPDSQYILRFIVQAYPSMLFNHYALQRRQQEKEILEGDILIQDDSPRRNTYTVMHKQRVIVFDYRQIKSSHSDNLLIPLKGDSLPVSPTRVEGEESREKQNNSILTPTGPTFGLQTILPPEGTPAYKSEKNIFNHSVLTQGQKLIRRLHLYGGRRPLWVTPSQTDIQRDQEDVILSFSLPTGSYATVLLASLFKDIDQHTCVQNRWLLPDAYASG